MLKHITIEDGITDILKKAIKYPYDEYIRADKAPDIIGLKLIFLYKTHDEPHLKEWVGETEDKFVVIRLSDTFIAVGIGDTDYDKEKNLTLMGMVNKKSEEEISIEQIMKYIYVEMPEDYYEFV